jgi:hypothetical protein
MRQRKWNAEIRNGGGGIWQKRGGQEERMGAGEREKENTIKTEDENRDSDKIK